MQTQSTLQSAVATETDLQQTGRFCETLPINARSFHKKGIPQKDTSRCTHPCPENPKREAALQYNEKSNTDDCQDIHFITTYSPGFNAPKDIVKKNWDILKRSMATKSLGETRVIFGTKRPENLKDILVSARLPKPERAPRKYPNCLGLNKCSKIKCDFCPLISKTGRIMSTVTGREYECKKNVTCRSSNLIYCITCKSCRKQYVGQTGDSIQKRFFGHKGSINRKTLTEDIGRHFNLPGHQGLRDMEISVLDFIFAPAKTSHGLTLRLQIEFNWIQRLRSMLPLGINTKDRTPLETNCRNWRHYRKGR